MTPSVWDWRGKPSIMYSAPKTPAEFAGVRREKKQRSPTFGPSTTPLSMRMDFDAVRDYRMSGHTWDECAAQFGCCVKSLINRTTEIYPELRRMRFGKKQGPAPVEMPVDQIIAAMLDGESLRGASRMFGLSHPTVRHRLLQSKEGREAVALARARARPNEFQTKPGHSGNCDRASNHNH